MAWRPILVTAPSLELGGADAAKRAAAAAVAADGSRFAICEGCAVAVFGTEDGAERWRFTTTGPCCAVAWAPDGSVCVAAAGSRLEVLDAATGARVATVDHSTAVRKGDEDRVRVRSVACATRYAASCGSDGSLVAWRLRDLESSVLTAVRPAIPEEERDVEALLFDHCVSEDLRKLLSKCADGAAAEDALTACAFDGAGARLAAGGEASRVFVFDGFLERDVFTSTTRVAELEGHAAAVTAVAWSHGWSNNRLASLDVRGEVRLWTLQDEGHWSCTLSVPRAHGAVAGAHFPGLVAFSDDDSYLSTAAHDGLKVWDILLPTAAPRPVLVLRAHGVFRAAALTFLLRRGADPTPGDPLTTTTTTSTTTTTDHHPVMMTMTAVTSGDDGRRLLWRDAALPPHGGGHLVGVTSLFAGDLGVVDATLEPFPGGCDALSLDRRKVVARVWRWRPRGQDATVRAARLSAAQVGACNTRAAVYFTHAALDARRSLLATLDSNAVVRVSKLWENDDDHDDDDADDGDDDDDDDDHAGQRGRPSRATTTPRPEARAPGMEEYKDLSEDRAWRYHGEASGRSVGFGWPGTVMSCDALGTVHFVDEATAQLVRADETGDTTCDGPWTFVELAARQETYYAAQLRAVALAPATSVKEEPALWCCLSFWGQDIVAYDPTLRATKRLIDLPAPIRRLDAHVLRDPTRLAIVARTAKGGLHVFSPHDKRLLDLTFLDPPPPTTLADDDDDDGAILGANSTVLGNALFVIGWTASTLRVWKVFVLVPDDDTTKGPHLVAHLPIAPPRGGAPSSIGGGPILQATLTTTTAPEDDDDYSLVILTASGWLATSNLHEAASFFQTLGGGGPRPPTPRDGD